MRSYLSCLLAASLGTASFAVDVSGKWNGNLEVKLPDGNTVTQPAWAEFDQIGEAVTGSAGGGDSDESSPIEKGKKVDPAKTLFRIGSVSKLFTWTAVMQWARALHAGRAGRPGAPMVVESLRPAFPPFHIEGLMT